LAGLGDSKTAGSPRDSVAHGEASQKSKRGRRSALPRYPGCAQALQLLTLYPVHATAVPRLHVAPRWPDGSRLVYDRATSDRFVVYSPRFAQQFRAGYRARLWYVRAKSDPGDTPQSVGFTSVHEAVEAVRRDRWRSAHAQADRVRNFRPCRVSWS
jgi:hypothetical protein